MNFKIPSSFKLMGRTVTIEWVDRLDDELGAVGSVRYRKNKILLQKPTETFKRSESILQEYFFHELVHWLFFQAGERGLGDNEKLVDLLGCLLHQAIITMEYN